MIAYLNLFIVKVVIFDFGGVRNCNKIEKLLKAKMGSAFCYIYKDGKSKIKLS